MRRVRRFHRTTGIVLAIFVTTSALSGLTWAFSQQLYLRKDYLRIKHEAPAPSLATATVPIDAALRTAQNRLGTEVTLRSAALTTTGGMLFYEVSGKQGRRTKSVMIDAVTGELLSPLVPARAIAIARQYARGNDPVVIGTRFTPKYETRRNEPPRPAWIVSFSRPQKTEIVIDSENGHILEESDPARRFQTFIMKLHRLDYFDTDKMLTIIPGLGLLLLTGTGIALVLPRRKRPIQA